MQEYKLLNALAASRKNYEEGRHYVTPTLLSQLGTLLLNRIDEYYALDEDATHADLELIREAMLDSVSDVPKHVDTYKDYFTVLAANSDVSGVNILKELRDAVIREKERKLADAIMAHNEDEKGKLLEEVLRLRDASSIAEEQDEEYVSASVQDLLEDFSDKNKLGISPRALNDKLNGGLRRGHHLLLAARPEVGKSMFAINIAAGLVQQGYRVLYVGNEDPIPDLIMRLISSLTNMPEDQIISQPDEAMELAREKGYDNAVFVGMSPGTIEAISAAARRHEPDAIVIDQLRNLSASTENNTTRLDMVARGARNLGRKHNAAIISVTQAGDSAEGKLNLNMGDVDGSNTGVPGATDVMVMVGCDESYHQRNLRVLNLPKNKVGRDHRSIVVRVQPTVSRVYTDDGLNVPTVGE